MVVPVPVTLQAGPLPPSTTIYYRVGDPELAMSPELNFTTQPVLGPESLPYRCAAGQACPGLAWELRF